uniref:Uncharacterized protein n=1 Tax=Ditylenchus dipsaci TaxID=166011 RepID=A0A915ER54_9BILA
MGERKGQNFYYPPDFNYKTHKSLNSYHGTHALRERASKIKEGFWLFGLRCRSMCEKKKIGMYYTTPLYEFKMKCHLCDNYYIIRTDPKNFDYEMVEGLRRQEKRFDPSTIDNLAPVDRSFNQKLSADAMFKKEHDADDKKKLDSEETQVARIEWIQTRMYDDYGVNSYLRRSFRGEKSQLNEKRIADEDLQKRLSTNIRLQPESKDDKIMAKQILKYKDSKSYEERSNDAREELMHKPLFSDSNIPSTSKSDAKTIITEQLRKKQSTFTTFRKRGVIESSRALGIVLSKEHPATAIDQRQMP